jgi:hypothetical protein
LGHEWSVRQEHTQGESLLIGDVEVVGIRLLVIHNLNPSAHWR